MSGDCLLMQKQDGTTQCDAIFIFVCTSEEGGVYSSTVLQFVFCLATLLSGIVAGTGENSTHLIYNVGGKRLNKPQKGLNIVNGKKMIY